MVQPHFSAQENKQLNSIVRKKQALVYGKRASFWQVGLCCKYLLRQAATEVCGKTISTSFTPYFFFTALSLLLPSKAFCPPVQRSNFTLFFYPLQGKNDYLDVVHKYFDIHGTVDTSTKLPSYVTNHGIVNGGQVHSLLRQSKV